mmetsp:Transcript_15847/g.40539  ORF Transcript_15847/g.40539 Transcript_15847/m.40539 type:complete len:120 (+) Transcript_15847:1152-1511(+)
MLKTRAWKTLVCSTLKSSKPSEKFFVRSNVVSYEEGILALPFIIHPEQERYIGSSKNCHSPSWIPTNDIESLFNWNPVDRPSDSAHCKFLDLSFAPVQKRDRRENPLKKANFLIMTYFP